LGHEKWLDIDFTLLSRNAVICGAYTTALLFLELAAEPGGSKPDVVAAEQILFEIYSHIDEPDGFYGITTTDLRQFLIKRFHHEKQWEKAFRFHGAALEASGRSTDDAEGLLNSFHAFGFDHLAIETLQSSHMGVESNASSSGMNYRLGWRTETWDLPDRHEDDLGASLYLALRAVYRERDMLTVDSILHNALFSEMTKLRMLGPENLAEIRQVAQNLMCLNQVTHWRGKGIQKSLESKHIDINKWSDFIHVDPDFE
jgi:ataxia telangiectasia mutated family protein